VDFKEKIPVLDYGHIRGVDFMGGDLSIVRAARVSHDADWRAGLDGRSDEKLINYLWSHKHTSPFEAVTMTFEVQAPLVVFWQWVRHRTQSYNMVSGRYAELPRFFYTPYPEMVGRQSTLNKQGREYVEDPEFLARRTDQVARQKAYIEEGIDLYEEFLADDWPRELARGHLPFFIYYRMFCTGNLLNFFRFLSLRDDPHTQYETRVYAEAMKPLIEDIAPISLAAFEASR
jgi:thymidylate synthase (FAD)